MPEFCHCLWVQTHKYHVANNELACCGLPEAMGSLEPGLNNKTNEVYRVLTIIYST